MFYAAGAGGGVHGVSAANGKPVWRSAETGPVLGLQPLGGGFAAVLSIDHAAGGDFALIGRGLDLERREFVWERDGFAFLPHVSADGRVVLGDAQGHVRAFDPRTGDETWRLTRR